MQEFDQFTSLFLNERPKLIRHLMANGRSPEDAEDIVQTAYCNILRHWEDVPILFPSRWLRKAVENAHLQFLRYHCADKRSGELISVDDHEPKDQAADPEQKTFKTELLGVLDDCLRALNPTLRLTLVMSQDSPLSQIAALTKTKEGTVKSRIHTAKRLVNECLKRKLKPDRGMTVMEFWEGHIKDALAYGLKDAEESAHLDERQLIALATGAVSDEQITGWLDHLVVCESCARYFRRIQTALMERNAVQQRPPRSAWRSPWLGLAAGLLLGFGVFQVLRQEAPALQNPLRLELDATAPTRGQEPIALMTRDGLDLQLGLLPGKAYPTYRLDLLQDGVVRARFERVRLENGALSLILPISQVPEGRFELVAMGLDGGVATPLATFALDVRKAKP